MMMRKKKILLSLVVLAVLTVLFGSIISDATEITTGSGNTTGSVTVTASNTGNNTGSVTINPTNVGANRNTTNTNTNAVNSTVSTYSSNSSNTNSNTANTGLPYAGAGNIMGAIVLGLVFVGSAVYAYKKVTDYNV